MNAPVGQKEEGIITKAFLVIAVYFCLLTGTSLAGDLTSTICNNEVVSVGDRKSVVLDKCGPPLSRAQETVDERTVQTIKKKKTAKKLADKDTPLTSRTKTVKERGESWTYNIDGSYRFFIFKEGKLARIEAGGLVR